MTHPLNSHPPTFDLVAHDAARSIPPSRFLGPLLHEEDGPLWINCVAWSPDDSVVVTGTGDNYNGEDEAAAWLWDAVTGAAVAEIPSDQRVNALAWHPNGQW